MEYPEAKCDNKDCDNIVNLEGDYWSTDWLSESTYCYSCGQSDMDYPSTVWRITPDEKPERVHFGDLLAMDEYGEVPQWFRDLWVEGTGRAWKASDAWRGHFESIQNMKDVVPITNGWTTGWTDDFTHRKELFNDWVDELVNGSEQSPVEIFIMFEPTSNVFSTGCDVFCLKANEQAARQYLVERFEGLSNLENALA